MSDLAEKLKSAGADTIGAQFTTACTEALRAYPDNIAKAWGHVGTSFGHEFMLGLLNDMRGPHVSQSAPTIPSSCVQTVVGPARLTTIATLPPYKPRVIPPERLEKRRELERVLRSKYKNSGGISWSDVGWHELALLTRDGREAGALLAACPGSVPNDGRTVGDVLGVKETDAIIAAIRSYPIPAGGT